MSNNTQDNSYYKLKSLVIEQFDQIDELISRLVQSHVDLIPKISNHLIQSKGKRIRPLLTLVCAKLIDCNMSEVIKLATSIEFIHTATLFHDDVIDESKLRRGLETANSIWSNKASILIGDFLLSNSFKLMVECGNIDALKLLADVSINLIEAEVWQLDLIGKIDILHDDYFKLITGKTASLFAAACSVSAVINNSSREIISALYNFGLNLGIIFQISDDILDYFSNSSALGKTLGNDFYEKKITLPLILLLETAESGDRKTIIENISATSSDFNLMLEFMYKYEIEDKAVKYLNIYKNRAFKALDLFDDHSLSTKLKDLLNYVIHRVN